MTTPEPKISGPCGGGQHHACTGVVEVGRLFVHCECPVRGCLCHHPQASSGGSGMTAAQREALHD
jgi:hypothetical protein